MAKGKNKKKKKSTAASGKTRNTAKQKKEESVTPDIASRPFSEAIWGLVHIALGAFIFAAVQFHAAGTFGNSLGDFFKGILGVIGLVLPWYLILLGILMILRKTAPFNWKYLVAGLIMLLMLCLLNSGRFIDSNNLVMDVGRFYTEGIALKGGGVLGMAVGTFLVKWIGMAGLYILSLLIFLICILLIFNTSLSRAIAVMGQKKKEQQERRAELVRQKAMERLEAEKLREEREKNMLSQILDEPVAPTLEKPAEKLRKFRKSEGTEKRSVPPEPVVEEPTQLEIEQYEENKISAKDIAKGAAKIGKDLGLSDGKAPLTKSSDKAGAPEYHKPPLDLLNKPVRPKNDESSQQLKEKAILLEDTMRSFNVDAHVVRVSRGPAVTRYEIQPEAGVKVSKITSLANDIALNLRAKSIRIEAPIPGKAAVGIEVENDNINMVTLSEIIGSEEFKQAKSKITFAVGKDIAGKPIVADLKSMPHMLIAGSTGSGKSVCINSIITSILYKADPDEVKLVLVDPKVVELGHYNGIPHLLIPVVTDPSKAAAALSWAVVEMTNRYKMFATENARDLASYNRKMVQEDREDEVMPQIVIIIDELADLMMAAPSQVEESICRLAQMARAAGMHLIVATQRPSVDIITGVIKANIPSRIAFAVSSQVDSRTILDMSGAEHLVGKGDMLFNPLGTGKPIRVQGTFISDEEVEKVIDYVRSQVEETKYAEEVIDTISNGVTQAEDSAGDADELLPEAIELVVMQGQASVSMLQRRFRIGYNRAARIVDQMEARGIVGPQDGSKPRNVLMTEEEYYQTKEETNESSL